MSSDTEGVELDAARDVAAALPRAAARKGHPVHLEDRAEGVRVYFDALHKHKVINVSKFTRQTTRHIKKHKGSPKSTEKFRLLSFKQPPVGHKL